MAGSHPTEPGGSPAGNEASQDEQGENEGDPRLDVQAQAEWDPDTDEVNSISSTELHERRPNRWRGAGMTWRDLTEEDRLTYEALVSLRNQDLAVHLFNAFALKHRRRRDPARDEDGGEEDEDIDMETGESVRDTDWVPPPSWTAWPMRADLVPLDEPLVGSSTARNKGDANEAYTIQRRDSGPSPALEELVCATILRIASRRFRKRQLRGEVDGYDGCDRTYIAAADHQQGKDTGGSGGSGNGNGPDSSSDDEWASREPPSGQENSSPPPGAEQAQDRESSPPQTSQQRRERRRTYMPAFSADDERSYALLRPPARRILDLLDRTLMRLHNARVSGIRDLSESSGTSSGTSGKEQSDASGSRSTSRRRETGVGTKKRGRGRWRTTALMRTAIPKPDIGKSGKRRVGRPRKRPIPMEGESEREMLIRFAKERHEAVPLFSDDDDDANDDVNGDGDDEDEDEGGAKDKLFQKKEKRKGKGPVTGKVVITRREGETEQEFLIRFAREKHVTLPEFAFDKGKKISTGHTQPNPAQKVPNKAYEMDLDTDGGPNDNNKSSQTNQRAGTGEQILKAAETRPATEAPLGDQKKRRYKEKLVSQFPLRDWSDVLGAAALAGFPQAAISRAAQRCADLFGQGMEMHTIHEVPADAGTNGVRTTMYLPGVISQRRSPFDEYGGDDGDNHSSTAGGRGETSDQNRHRLRRSSLSRESSLAPRSMTGDYSSPASDAEEGHGVGRARSRSRRRVGSAAAGPHRCPHEACPRSIRGFGRHANLARHIRLVHGGSSGHGAGAGGAEGGERGEEEGADEEEAVDSTGEVDGAVHVDGFLRLIKVRKGWRGEDVQQRHPRARAVPPGRKKTRGRRRRSDAYDGGSGDDGEE